MINFIDRHREIDVGEKSIFPARLQHADPNRAPFPAPLVFDRPEPGIFLSVGLRHFKRPVGAGVFDDQDFDRPVESGDESGDFLDAARKPRFFVMRG